MGIDYEDLGNVFGRARIQSCNAWAIIGPVNWYGPTRNLKALFDRMVCMNGGNPDETTIRHKDPEAAMALEHDEVWPTMSLNHLEGRTAGFFSYGDDGGDELDAVTAAARCQVACGSTWNSVAEKSTATTRPKTW